MPGLKAAFERIGNALERRLPLTHAAGVALAVTDVDETLGVVVRGFADAASGTPVTPTTRFQIGSISKSFAAAIAVQEAEAGRLDLHASINELLPWLDVPEPFGPITPHHLLTHTSGLIMGTEEAFGALAVAERLRDRAPGFKPGERFWYSNDGYKLLGLVLERVAGAPVDRLIEERVLRPLGMTHSEAAITNATRADLATGYAPIHDDRPARLTHPLVPAQWTVSNTADGSIVSDVVDMAAYARAILNAGRPLVSSAAFERLVTPAIADAELPGFGYGYGWWVGRQDGRRRIRHSGGMVGYTALLAVDPDNGLGCVMLLNGEGDRDEVVRYGLACVRAAVAGDELPDHYVAMSPETIDGAGEYAGSYGALGVRREGDSLAVTLDGVDARLHRTSTRDAFLVADEGLDRFELRFHRDSAGGVVAASHGSAWFDRDGCDPLPIEPHPPAWDAYPGLYRSNDPWVPVIRIALRHGRLVRLATDSWEDPSEAPLVPLDDGTFRVGEEDWIPERISFGGAVAGRATRAMFNGGAWYRSFEE
jgi:CubicO group peptidase (beta-lactamase class C family)